MLDGYTPLQNGCGALGQSCNVRKPMGWSAQTGFTDQVSCQHGPLWHPSLFQQLPCFLASPFLPHILHHIPYICKEQFTLLNRPQHDEIKMLLKILWWRLIHQHLFPLAWRTCTQFFLLSCSDYVNLEPPWLQVQSCSWCKSIIWTQSKLEARPCRTCSQKWRPLDVTNSYIVSKFSELA